MNTNRYNYSYANRIGNNLIEPFYKLYKTNTKYLETLDIKHEDIAEVIFNAVSMLLLNVVAIPLSLPLWFIGKVIVQYTSPKLNYSPLSIDTKSPSNQILMKANLLDMVKDHKETIIIEVFSHGSYYTLYDYRMKPNHGFETIPDLESSKATDSMPFLERQMILTKLKDSNRLIEVIQKKINSDQKSSSYDYSGHLVTLVSKNHKLPLEEAINLVATNFYSSNNITYQGANCLLQGIGVLS